MYRGQSTTGSHCSLGGSEEGKIYTIIKVYIKGTDRRGDSRGHDTIRPLFGVSIKSMNKEKALHICSQRNDVIILNLQARHTTLTYLTIESSNSKI